MQMTRLPPIGPAAPHVTRKPRCCSEWFGFCFAGFLGFWFDKMETLNKLKQFDAYPKTLEDFRVKTWGGATGKRRARGPGTRLALLAAAANRRLREAPTGGVCVNVHARPNRRDSPAA